MMLSNLKTYFLKLVFFCFVFTTVQVLAQTPSNTKPLIVVLDWVINPDHAPLLVAEQQGFFKKQGLDVRLIQPSDPADGPKLVAAGKADVAITYQPQLLIQIDQGLPLIRFGSLVDSPLSCVVASKQQGISSFQDLKNKKVGYSLGGIDQAMMQTMLQKHGMSLSDIQFINVRFDLVQGLLSKRLAAFAGGMRNVEPIQLKFSGFDSQIFLPEANGFPTYDELIFVANKHQAHDPRLVQFLTALQQGIEYLKQNPELAWQGVIKQHPELNNPVNKKIWFASAPYFSPNAWALDRSKYDNFALFLKQQGTINKVSDLTSYTVQLAPASF
ncbi:MAG: ABC transporter substrate-binding protein [Proteobacteria bacterium]|nr:ABC transporter substrate-binding protein [Pseudomonadota bacterium]